MEYLMTYGWAILIIAVVLGALYSLGIFNGANFIGGTCIPAPGYLCSNPRLATDGILSFTYGYQGPNVTIVGFACTNSSVAPSSFSSSGSSTLEPGQEESVSVTCTLPEGSQIGTRFSGYLWVEYDQNGQSDLIAEFASISTTASTSPPSYLAVITYASGLIIVNTSDENTYKTASLGFWNSGLQPIAISPDGSKAYVGGNNGGGGYPGFIATVDLSNDVVVNAINTGVAPVAIAITPDGSKAFVTGSAGYPGLANVISLTTDTVTNDIVEAGYLNGVAVDPSGNYAYIVSWGYATVNAISTSSYLPAFKINVWVNPTQIAIASNGDTAVVAGGGYPGGITTIDLTTHAVANTLTLGGTPQEVAMSPDGSKEYVADYFGGTEGVGLITVSTSTYEVLNSLSLNTGGEQATGIAATPDGSQVFVISQNAAYIVETSNDVVVHTISGINTQGDESVAIT
jgi:DNA-binding beta-propeller fold protein YncE